MSDIKQENQESPRDAVEQVADPKRRRLTGAALAGSGVLLTLASRPVLANRVCLSPSGFQSGNLSRQNQGNLPCSGRSPDYWRQKNSISDGAWAAAGCEPGKCTSQAGTCSLTEWHDTKGHLATKFCDVFPCSGQLAIYQYLPNSFPLKKISLMQVMHGSQGQLGAHLAAAYLNAKSGKNQMPSVSVVLAIASSIATSGNYSPAPGVTWNSAQVVSYLKTTMPR